MKTKSLPVNTLIEGINQILSKNRESLTVDEVQMLEDIKLRMSESSSTQFIKTTLSHLLFRKLFDFFFEEKFNKWHQMLSDWAQENLEQ
jgi:hypothetical protein